MSYENQDVEQQGQQQQQDGGAEDLTSALSESETQFVGEQKKQLSTGTIVVGGLLALCVAGTYFMYVRNGPAAANANPAAASADATITQFLSNDAQNVERMKQLLKDTEKAVQQFQEDQTKKQIPIYKLATNPFRLDSADTNVAVEKANEKKKKDQLVAAANALKIQSIIHGKRRAVMINNTLFTEGQTVEGFTIDRIAPGEVIVKNGNYKFKLTLQK